MKHTITKRFTIMVLFGVFVVGAQSAALAEQKPIHCSVICKDSKTYECCFAVCVCNTDPDPDVRRGYCVNVSNVCTVPRS